MVCTVTWNRTTISQSVHRYIRRSGLMVPLALELPSHEYFQQHAREVLLIWLEQARQAIAIRQAAIQESLAKARYNNLLNLQASQTQERDVWSARSLHDSNSLR